ncbi:MAG: chorismate mutase [Planctomycetes bacterium]|nr:chorismate mutase [Planctomycetota bacterium]
MTDHPDSLDSARQRIGAVDRQLIGLLRQRMDAVRVVAGYKRDDASATLYDPEREAEVRREWERGAEAVGLSPYHAGRILREVLNYSRRIQEPTLAERPRSTPCRVGYQGSAASYGELAIGRLFARRGVAVVDRIGSETFAAVFDALETSAIDYALVPVDNTSIGSIDEVCDLLAVRDIVIVDEEVMPVEHCLAAMPGTSIAALRVIRSHPAALQQCQRLLAELPAAAGERHFDTAGAAQSVRDAGDPRLGCICSVEAAVRFGLQVLRRDVADCAGNQTRFLLLARQPEATARQRPVRTTVLFGLADPHRALADVVTAAARHGVDLVRLERRSQAGSPHQHLFLVDFLGHREDAAVGHVLEALRRLGHHVHVLGSYPARADEAAAPRDTIGGDRLP